MPVSRHFIQALIFCMAVLISNATTAQSPVQIQIEPGTYEGQWAIIGVTRSETGPKTIRLDPGDYQMQVGGSSLGRFNFAVDAAGNVSSGQMTSATSSGNTLTFKTSPIMIDPTIYSGSWFLLSVSRQETGRKNFVVVPDLGYLLQVGGSSLGRFNFAVDAAGGVSSGKPTSATAIGNTLTFKTSPITIDPAAYTGSRHGWTILAVTFEETDRKDNIIVVPDLTYLLQVGGSSLGRFNFAVDSSGNVSSGQPTSATSSGNTLTFKTSSIMIDPTTYSGPWFLLSVSRQESGRKNFVVVPDLGYLLQVGTSSLDRHTFNVDGSGIPEPTEISGTINGETFKFLLTKTMSIITVDIDIKPGSSTNPINPKSKGKIPVAILTTPTFDATMVDPESIHFGKIGTEAKAMMDQQKDVDEDGDIDLLLKFETQETGIQCRDTSATLNGEANAGLKIKGSDSITTPSCNE